MTNDRLLPYEIIVVEDYVIQMLIDSLFKFRLELPGNPKTE